jgi:hypothetical protein
MKKQPGCYGHTYKIDTMKSYQNIASLFLRLSIAAGFLSASADRFGWWGINGAKGVSWGDWQHFVNYTNVLLPFAPPCNTTGNRFIHKVGSIQCWIVSTVFCFFNDVYTRYKSAIQLFSFYSKCSRLFIGSYTSL